MALLIIVLLNLLAQTLERFCQDAHNLTVLDAILFLLQEIKESLRARLGIGTWQFEKPLASCFHLMLQLLVQFPRRRVLRACGL